MFDGIFGPSAAQVAEALQVANIRLSAENAALMRILHEKGILTDADEPRLKQYITEAKADFQKMIDEAKAKKVAEFKEQNKDATRFIDRMALPSHPAE